MMSQCILYRMRAKKGGVLRMDRILLCEDLQNVQFEYHSNPYHLLVYVLAIMFRCLVT